ncbi:MAG: DUF3826 domain-containing protein [Ferruginibacter sp.]
MRYSRTVCVICWMKILTLSFAASAQSSNAVKNDPPDYTTVINQRANKIVATLGIADSAKFYRVQNIITQQYRNLSAVHDSSNARSKAAKINNTDKDKATVAVKEIETGRDAALDKFHQQYIAKLSAELSADQVTKIKDGMTYNILPVTYKAYMEMLPTLTDVQKKQLYAWLEEAREHAIDAESSDKKHAVFGKYKGRINNYLSAQGIDMKKAGDEWQARIKAEKEKPQQ